MAERLPAELLTPILQHVHRNSRDALISCMQSSPGLFSIGFKIMYRNITLRLKDALKLEKAIQNYLEKDEDGKLHFPHTRCFRLIIPGDGRDYGFNVAKHDWTYTRSWERPPTWAELSSTPTIDKIAERGVEALQRILPYFSKLRTFSVMSYNGHRLNTWDPQSGLGTPNSAIAISASNIRSPGPSINLLAKLVDTLPPSIRDLSIDLSELSRYDALHRCDLCPAINRLAPRLEHLNLHLRTYCSDLLSTSPNKQVDYSDLQSVIIRIHGFNARLCCRRTGTTANSIAILNLDAFTRNLKTMMAASRMPKLRQFILISKRRPHGIRQHQDAKWTIYVRELVSNQTAAIPRIFIDSRTPAPGNTFIASARTMVRLPSKCTFIDPRYWDKEYVGKSGSIRRFVEGRAGWVCFAHGPHIPGLRVADIGSALEEGYDIRAPPPNVVSVYRQKNDKTCALWEDEDKEGVKLLEPAVWDGVLDNNVLRRVEVT